MENPYVPAEGEQNFDITFCFASSCPHKECMRHSSRIPKNVKWISVADFAPVCRQYIGGILDLIEEDENG